MKKLIVPTILLATLLTGFFIGRATTEPQVIKETVTVTDSTTVDSLRNEVTYWKDIAEARQDTIESELEIPEPVEVSPDVRDYDVPYSDENLAANIGLTVEGYLQDADLSYYLKREQVTETTTTVYKTRTINTVTERLVRQNPPVFSSSFEAGYMAYLNTDSFQGIDQTPYVEWQPSMNLLGFEITGTLNLSRMPHGKVGVKFNF